MVDVYAAFAATGALAGLLSGLLGIGGGIVIVPALWAIFQVADLPLGFPVAIASSLCIMVFTTLSSASSHYRKGHVRIQVWRYLVPGMWMGMGLGAWLLDGMDPFWLPKLFSVFLVMTAIRMAFSSDEPSVPYTPLSATRLLPLGILVGTLSGLLGIGGGIVIVPWLSRRGLSMKEASGTAVACTFPMVCLAAVLNAYWGLDNIQMEGSVGYLYWPAILSVGLVSMLTAPIGSWLSAHCPQRRLKQAFSVLLFVVAWKLGV